MEVTKVQDGKKALEIGTSQGPFDQSYPALLKAGFTFHSAEQEAHARILAGPNSYVSRNGTYVNNAHVYQPKDSGIVLIVDGKHNPILANPSEATNAHRNGNEFYVNTPKLLNRAERDPKKAVKSGVLALARPVKKGMLSSSEANPFEVSVDELAENPYFAFTLRDEAKPYGQFLKSAGIKSVPVYLVNESNTKAESNPFARLLWVRYLVGRSTFLGGDWFLNDDDYRVRGVRPSASAVSASTQKSGTNGHKAIATPTLKQVLRTVRPFVADANRTDVKQAIAKLYK